MRVIMFPLCGLTNLAGDSDFIAYRDLVESALAKEKNWHFYFVMPDTLQDQYPDIPHTTFIPAPMSPDFVDELYRSPDEMKALFSRRSGKYLADIVFTTRIGGNLVLQNQISDFRRNDPVPVVAIESMVRYFNKTNRINTVLRAMGYAECYTWFLSTEEKRRASEHVYRYCAPILLKQFNERSFVQPTGVRTKVLDETIKSVPKNENFQLFYGGRFAINKNPELVVKLSESIFSYGRPIDVVYTTQHVEGSKHLNMFTNGKGSIKKLTPNCGRDDFLFQAASSHVFICASIDESWPSGFFEQLYLMEVGIFPDKDWTRATLPPNYPFVFTNELEAHTMLRWIYENYDEAKKKVSWVRGWMRENMEWEKTAWRVLDVIRSAKQNYHPLSATGEDSLFNITMSTAEEMKEFDFSDYLKQFKKKCRGYDPTATARLSFPTRYEIYRTLLDNGYSDTFENSEPHIYKS